MQRLSGPKVIGGGRFVYSVARARSFFPYKVGHFASPKSPQERDLTWQSFFKTTAVSGQLACTQGAAQPTLELFLTMPRVPWNFSSQHASPQWA